MFRERPKLKIWWLIPFAFAVPDWQRVLCLTNRVMGNWWRLWMGLRWFAGRSLEKKRVKLNTAERLWSFFFKMFFCHSTCRTWREHSIPSLVPNMVVKKMQPDRWMVLHGQPCSTTGAASCRQFLKGLDHYAALQWSIKMLAWCGFAKHFKNPWEGGRWHATWARCMYNKYLPSTGRSSVKWGRDGN